MSDQHWSQMMLPRERIEQLETINGELRQQLQQAKEENERVRQANIHTMDVFEDMKAAKEQAESRIAELVGAGNRLCYELESWLATEHDKESVRAMNIWRKVLEPTEPNSHQQQQAGNQGRERLWTWFSLSYASFLVLPRAGMHQMPDEWQNRMAQLLNDWDEAAKNQPDLEFIVQGRKDGKLCQVPEWIRNYRHPDRAAWNHFFGRAEQCTYPGCNCPFDMGPDHQCLRGLPVIRK